MIRLSTKGRYGTRLMLNLATRYKVDGDAIILKSISEEEAISIRYLEQIIIPLKINKLVRSIRGAGGGYTLARDPSRINLREILHALEGSCCLVECVEEPDSCERQPYCAAFEVWKEATLLLKNYFESITLADLVKVSEKKRKRTRSH
ncbi:MAG TPA: Rrf2 family transcriptional regulator [Acidobacteriota bacterium]|nr:Rrf2 family transcriptional regulator [Acidobacteriota bacterium]